MKLNDYFQAQKNHILTDVDKLELYQKFLYKRTTKSPIKRFSFVHAKSFVYTMVVGILIVGVYGMYFLNGSIDTPRFSIHSNVNTVQADYIAKVIDFNGNFSIEHQGVLAQTTNIGNGDTILLKEWAAMVFEIDSGTKSKILGPAKLTLQQITEPDSPTKYRINLIYGDFIQMEGTGTVQNVELSVDDILIRQGDQTKPVNFQLINQNGNRILKNNGPKLIITKNGDQKETQVNNKEVLAMQNNDITLFKSRNTFTTAMQKWDISQTFALNKAEYTDIKTTVGDTTGTQDGETPVSLLSLLAPQTQDTTTSSTDNTTAISQDIASLMGDTKKVPTPDQINLLRWSLNSEFLKEDFQKAVTARNVGDQDAYNAIVQKIRWEIQQIDKSFGLNYSDSSSLQDNISALISSLQTNYDIAPSYIISLQSINAQITSVEKIQRGQSVNKTTTSSASDSKNP